MFSKKENFIRLVFLLIFIGIFALIAVHFLREDGDFIANSMSNYAASEYGYVAEIGFVAFIIAEFIVGFLLLDGKNWKMKTAAALFFLCGICLIFATIFNDDIDGIIETRCDYIHLTAAIIVFTICPAKIFLLGSNFRKK